MSAIAPSMAHAVEAPRDPRGTLVAPAEIKWEWSRVSDATRYQVNVNGSYVGMANDLYFYSRNLSPGNYTFTVQAVNDNNGRYSSPSQQSAAITVGGGSSGGNHNGSRSQSDVNPPPDTRGTVVRQGEIKWEWNPADGAAQYEVFVNNSPVGLTTDLFVYTGDLAAGEYAMFVRSVDNNGGRSGDSAVARQTITADNAGSGTNSNVNASSNNTNGLPAPRDPRGTRVRPAEIKWEYAHVDGASEYEVTVNGQAYRSSTLYLYTANLPIGEHTMTVKAVASDGSLSAASIEAKASTWQNADGSSNDNNSNASNGSPGNVRGTQVGNQEAKWEWGDVPGATGYQTYVDGTSTGITQDNFLYSPNLSSGDHTFSVAAIDSQGRHSVQSASVVVYISGDFNNGGGGGGAAPPPPAPAPAPAPADDNGLIDPTTWNMPGIGKPGYDLVFSDEFNANALNRSRWNTQLRWDGSHNGDRYEYRVINDESQLYVNIYSQDQQHLDMVASAYNPFQFDGNRLAIRSTKNPLRQNGNNTNYAFGPLSNIAPQQPYLSGAMSTYDKFSQKYGYFEARIKIPSHLGAFPAFWLHHQRREFEGTQKTEIDIMENLGHAPWYVYNSFHYFTGVSEGVGGKAHSIRPSPQGQIGNPVTGIDYSSDYHVYAAEWKPGHIRFLIDGQQVSEVWNSNSDHEELYMIFNLAVGGRWTNMPRNAGGTGRNNDGNPFPNQQDIDQWGDPALEIDWVRVYKPQ